MIRRAEAKDLQKVNELLCQVLEVHAKGRPDIFISGTKKYRDEELLELFRDDTRPVFVYTDEEDIVKGYAFCIFEELKGANNLYDMKTLYIDDVCVDENSRRQGIAGKLYRFVCDFAEKSGCDRITLNVWELNSGAKAFYEAMGMKPLKTVMEQKIENK